MNDSRRDLAALIDQLRLNESLIDKLKPTTFESVAAELVSQHKKLLEVNRHSFAGINYMAKFADSLNSMQSVAIEVKKLNHLIDVDSIERFRSSLSTLNIDKGYLVTNSHFSEAVKRSAAQYKGALELIDRSALKALINQYKVNEELFASNLFSSVNRLDIERLLTIEDPEPEQIEAINPVGAGLSEPQRNALVSVDALPLRLLTKILRAPHEVKNLSPRQFEEFVAETLAQLGFKDVVLTPRSRDGGKDVIASYQINGIPLSFYFECKKYADDNKVQLETLRALLGTMAHDARHVNKGVLVTTSTFTKGAREFILGESRLDGKDYDGVLGWIEELKKRM